MKKVKFIFSQTLVISTAILFMVGVQTCVQHFTSDYYMMSWPWYMPLSIILVGFMCSLPTVFLLSLDNLSKKQMWFRIVLHFLLVGGFVSLGGFAFKWFVDFREYLPVLVDYVLIYVFVWAVSAWMAKEDEKKINEAIQNFQDEE